MSERGRGWCLTGNYQSEDRKQELIQLLINEEYDYVCWGEESAPTTGQLHLQAYIKYKNARTFKSVACKMKGFHVTKATADAYKNREYCSKTRQQDPIPNEVFVEHGRVPRKTGVDGGEAVKRQWDDAFEAAKVGDLDEIPAELRIKHYSTFKRIQSDFMTSLPELDGVCGVWYYGKSRTGKSYSARKDFPDYYNKLPNKWFDGYQGQDYLLIDDFDICHKGLGHHLKIWADRYCFSAEIKGSTVSIRPKGIIVTSNYHPKEIWGDVPKTLEPILERFKVTRFCIPSTRGQVEDERVVDFNLPSVNAAPPVPPPMDSPPYYPPPDDDWMMNDSLLMSLLP